MNQSADPLREEVYRLTEACLRDELQPQQVARLEQLVCENETAAEHYVYYTLHATFLRGWAESGSTDDDARFDLAELAPALTALPHPPAADEEDAIRPAARLPVLQLAARAVVFLSQPVRFSLLVAAVATISFLLTAAQVSVQTARGTRATERAATMPALARVTDTNGCRWGQGGAPAADGRVVRGQRLILQEGFARLAFRQGTEVMLFAPLTLTLNSEQQVQLQHGTLTAHVPSLARGFTVTTPSARIVDLGTQFGVHVDAQGESEVQVFTGSIVVQPAREGKATVPAPRARRLAAGEAVWLDRQRRMTRVPQVALPTFVSEQTRSVAQRLDVQNAGFELPQIAERFAGCDVPGWQRTRLPGVEVPGPLLDLPSGIINASHPVTASPPAPEGRQWLFISPGTSIEQGLGRTEAGTTYVLSATLGCNHFHEAHRAYRVSFRGGSTAERAERELKPLHLPPSLSPGRGITVQLAYTPSAADAASMPFLFVEFAMNSGGPQLMVDQVEVLALRPHSSAKKPAAEGAPPRDAPAPKAVEADKPPLPPANAELRPR